MFPASAALDLDDALARGAETMPTDISLDVRRSLAPGDLARRQLALGLNVEPCRERRSRVRSSSTFTSPTTAFGQTPDGDTRAL